MIAWLQKTSRFLLGVLKMRRRTLLLQTFGSQTRFVSTEWLKGRTLRKNRGSKIRFAKDVHSMCELKRIFSSVDVSFAITA
jgi:hypothetical protein